MSLVFSVALLFVSFFCVGMGSVVWEVSEELEEEGGGEEEGEGNDESLDDEVEFA